MSFFQEFSRLSVALPAALCCVVASTNAYGQESEPVLIDYVVVPGDTCLGVAKRLLGDKAKYRDIHKHNPQLGKTPHRLVVGSVLKLPTTEHGPDAEVTVAVHDVRARATPAQGWQEADPGLALFRGWHVNTLTGALAELTFSDLSKIEMRENTLVIIYGDEARSSRRPVREARLERGTLRSRLGELAGSSQNMTVAMPSGNAELAGGSALIKVDGEGTSSVANHGDGAAALRSTTGARVHLTKGMGSKVARGKRPTPAKPLPATPDWAKGDDVFAGSPGLVGTIRGAWEPVAGAVGYSVEIFRGANGEVPVASIRVAASVHDYEIQGLPADTYTVRVSTVDSEEMESLPSVGRQQRVIAVHLYQPGKSESPARVVKPAGPVVQVLAGAKFDSPPDTQCRLDGGAWVRTVLTQAVGRNKIECSDLNGAPIPGFEIEVMPVHLELVGVDPTSLPLVSRNKATKHRVDLDSELAIPKTITLRSTAGLEVVAFDRVAEGSWDISLQGQAQAPNTGRVDVLLSDEDDAPVVASFYVEIESVKKAAPEPQPPVLPAGRAAFEIGLQMGVLVLPNDHRLYDPVNAQQEGYRTVTPDAWLRVGYYPTPWLGIELSQRFAAARTNADKPAAIFGGGLGLALRLPTRLAPFIGAQATFVGVNSSSTNAYGKDNDYGATVFGGLQFAVTPRVAVRLDLRDLMAFDRKGTYHLFSAGLGATMRFGTKR